MLPIECETSKTSMGSMTELLPGSMRDTVYSPQRSASRSAGRAHNKDVDLDTEEVMRACHLSIDSYRSLSIQKHHGLRTIGKRSVFVRRVKGTSQLCRNCALAVGNRQYLQV